MLTVLAFLVAMGVLVTFHELGHFAVARLCGVKVLRFSIGFGKPLLRYLHKGTEWVICPIPLGGYVRMLDEREGEVPAELRQFAFNTQPVLKRMAIVAAGPLANLLLAALFYWVLLAQGVAQLQPLVGTVIAQTPAAAAGFVTGDRILSVAGQEVSNWQEARLAFAEAGSTSAVIPVQVQTMTGMSKELSINASRFDDKMKTALQQGNPGLMPGRYLPVLGVLEDGGVAQRAGLRVGDHLLSVNDIPLDNWDSWVQQVRSHPGKSLKIEVLRDKTRLIFTLRPAAHKQGDELIGRIGAGPKIDAAWLKSISYTQYYTWPQAAIAAVDKTAATAWMSVKFIGRMLVGQASLNNLSGPLTIADVAGQSARQGLASYLEFLALISISIGVLNLLPIPVLDGGHLMYYVAELLRGRPVSERVQMLGQKIGFILLAFLMAFALLNDFSRQFGG
ncbi:RIP metalloprotease RseP [Neisseriaceae bacterium TC5R-5]|nr:RIP metalloprotease RseP [Neisseriaceae bacterium TC5R-5]